MTLGEILGIYFNDISEKILIFFQEHFLNEFLVKFMENCYVRALRESWCDILEMIFEWIHGTISVNSSESINSAPFFCLRKISVRISRKANR